MSQDCPHDSIKLNDPPLNKPVKNSLQSDSHHRDLSADAQRQTALQGQDLSADAQRQTALQGQDLSADAEHQRQTALEGQDRARNGRQDLSAEHQRQTALEGRDLSAEHQRQTALEGRDLSAEHQRQTALKGRDLSALKGRDRAKNGREGWTDRPAGWEEVNYEYVHDILHLPDAVADEKSNIGITSSIDSDVSTLVQDIQIVFVLAGGLDRENRNHQWVVRRLDLAARLWNAARSVKEGKEPKSLQILCLGGGTYHKPSPRNHQGFVMHESTVCAQYLIGKGIPHTDIMREWSSYDTIANGWFSLMNYAIPLNFRKIVIITSDFHMARTRAIFSWLWHIADRDPESELRFLAVSSDGIDPEVITARKRREEKSLARLQKTMNEIQDLQSFARWFYYEHSAYNCEVSQRPDLHRPQHDIDKDERESY